MSDPLELELQATVSRLLRMLELTSGPWGSSPSLLTHLSSPYISTLFCKVVRQLYSLSLQHALPNTCGIVFLNSYCREYEATSHFGFDLHLLSGHLHIFFAELSIQLLCLF